VTTPPTPTTSPKTTSPTTAPETHSYQHQKCAPATSTQQSSSRSICPQITQKTYKPRQRDATSKQKVKNAVTIPCTSLTVQRQPNMRARTVNIPLRYRKNNL